MAKCTACGTDEARDIDLPDIEKCHIHTAVVPAPMIPHSFCTPELLAHIAYEKYCKAVPLTRLEKDFKARGVNLSSTTMANWIIMASQRWLKPVWDQMHKELVESSVIHADETVVQVLHEPGKKAIRCDCWAHVRRKFVDALPNDKDLLPTSAAAKGVEYCNQLFLLERKYSGRNEKDEQIAEPMSSEERHNARQAQSKPVLEAFYAWLDTVEPAGGSNLAKEVQYAKNEKRYLYRFLESGDIPIDNNRAENAIRPMCVGRRNWLFSTSVKGADASVMMYSVAATACANGMKVEEYLTALFRSQPGTLVMPLNISSQLNTLGRRS